MPSRKRSNWRQPTVFNDDYGGRRTTRAARSSRPSSAASGSQYSTRDGVAINVSRSKQKAQNWVEVWRPPAVGIGFSVPQWVPVDKLTLQERQEYESANPQKQQQQQQGYVLPGDSATSNEQRKVDSESMDVSMSETPTSTTPIKDEQEDPVPMDTSPQFRADEPQNPPAPVKVEPTTVDDTLATETREIPKEILSKEPVADGTTDRVDLARSEEKQVPIQSAQSSNYVEVDSSKEPPLPAPVEGSSQDNAETVKKDSDVASETVVDTTNVITETTIQPETAAAQSNVATAVFGRVSPANDKADKNEKDMIMQQTPEISSAAARTSTKEPAPGATEAARDEITVPDTEKAAPNTTIATNDESLASETGETDHSTTETPSKQAPDTPPAPIITNAEEPPSKRQRTEEESTTG